jgi:glyoxylase-like metal-dependent hydrolase (beta-lactamase superfamily II)
MIDQIQTIRLPMFWNIASVNCYLIKTSHGFILIDAGMPSSRKVIMQALESAGCRPGGLRLIVITHGDFDHTGSAATLRAEYGAQIAMHPGDAGMADHADMFWNRERGRGSRLWGAIVPILFGFTQKNQFAPDLLLQEGDDLAPYGLPACVLSLPGHSSGSIGILTSAGDLFCGDLLMNDKANPYPGFGNPAGFTKSIRRLKGMPIRLVYPGHGPAFSMEQLV